ncbi:MAG: molybdenum cofactor biosynthesis protein MoaE [Verrucomicrobia bacterium]|nr:MAG: molybdenum cofactor biosynthesis protein MoaE [Verrucomicrobiota bacterium]
MEIEVQLTTEPIEPPPMGAVLRGGSCGAWAEFTGVVRGEEDGRPIAALEYEAYEPMALRVMRDILARLGERHPCHAVRVIHRVGIIPVGEAAIWIGVAAGHRQEAFAMLSEFMDELKKDVPIWKRRALGPEEMPLRQSAGA